MKFLNKLVLRKRVGSFYADHLPSDIRYRNRAGEEVSVPIENATVDELAFALQLASEEQSIVSRRRSAIEDSPSLPGRSHRTPIVEATRTNSVADIPLEDSPTAASA